jgi:hypothetical protein
MGCPFGYAKKMFLPPLNFQNIVLFFPVTSGVFAIYFYGEINNGILEATFIRGWFKLNRPFFVCIDIVLGHRVRN